MHLYFTKHVAMTMKHLTSNYLTSTFTITRFYTPDGIFEVHQKCSDIRRLCIKDSPSSRCTIGGHDFCLDYSEFKVTENELPYTQINPDHVCEHLIQHRMKLNAQGLVSLIVEESSSGAGRDKDKDIDVCVPRHFFHVHDHHYLDDRFKSKVEQEISTFLSQLKFC